MAQRSYEDRRSVMLRLSVMQYIVAACFAVLAVSFWYLQVAQHQKFKEMAENNHQRRLTLRAPRGVLFDRNGRVLVENRYAFTISLVREHTKDIDRTLRRVAAITGADVKALRDRVNRYRHEPRFRPIVLVEDASLDQVAAVSARKLELPDILIDRVPTRHYPTDALAAHLFGYVGEVTEAQLARAEFSGLQSGTIVGQAGVEHAYNKLLMGKDGARRVIVNSVGREIEVLGELPPEEGRRVKLTIDLDLQRALEEGFRTTGYNGAAVVLDPSSGEILAFLSLPTYDPNRFASGIDRGTWAALNTDKLRPLQNRATQGRYSPGSTFKIVVAVAALEEGIATPEFRAHCGGGATFYGRYFHCWRKEGHGTVDMRRAIEQSCNVYFYTLGNMLGVDRIHKWGTLLGLGVKSGIDLPNEVEGLVPSTAWKKARHGEKWYAGETISVSIGQGQVSVTPVSLAVMMATVANGGTRYVPHLVKAVDEGSGWKEPPPQKPLSSAKFKPQTIAAVHEGLWRVVNGAGTGGRARIPDGNVAGKTGTAQVISLQGGKAAAGRTDKDLRDHGWFVFFAPHNDAELAGVIFAEHAEHGYYGAPIAKHVINTYYAKKQGKPLPELVLPPDQQPKTPQPRPTQPVAANTAALRRATDATAAGASAGTERASVRAPGRSGTGVGPRTN